MNVDITQGSSPAINTRVDNPRLHNMYVAKDGSINRLPSLKSLVQIDNILAIHETTYNGGSYIVATAGQLLRVDSIGGVNPLSTIKTAQEVVRIAENQQNEVTIVTGANAYVYQQKTSKITTLSATQGFDLINPVDVKVLETITIIIGGQDKKWVASSPNNALLYGEDDVVVTDESMGNLVGCAELDNNLFVFGMTGIQRWLPALERTQYDFPFRQDTSYRSEFGCISTGSIVGRIDEIYYLASNFTVRSLSLSGDGIVSNDGMPVIISEYEEVSFSRGSVLYYQGQYFYQLTFLKSATAWVFNQSSRKWSESDDLIIDSSSGVSFNENAVVTTDDVYLLTSVHTKKALILQTPVMLQPGSTENIRSTLSGVRVNLIQGLSQEVSPQKIELAISKDNLRFSNHVTRTLGRVGETQQTVTWRMNITAQQFTFEIRYYGDMNLTIRSMTANIT